MSVTIVSKNTMCRYAVEQICKDHGLSVAGSFETVSEVHKEKFCEVLLIHITQNEIENTNSFENLTRNFSDIKIVVLAAVETLELLEKAYGNFIISIISEAAPAEVIIATLVLAEFGYNIRPNISQKSTFNSGISDLECEGYSSQHAAANVPSSIHNANFPPALLSSREATILVHLCNGHSNKTIGKNLGICDATVKSHLRASFRRIGANNRTQAALWAMQNLQPLS